MWNNVGSSILLPSSARQLTTAVQSQSSDCWELLMKSPYPPKLNFRDCHRRLITLQWLKTSQSLPPQMSWRWIILSASNHQFHTAGTLCQCTDEQGNFWHCVWKISTFIQGWYFCESRWENLAQQGTYPRSSRCMTSRSEIEKTWW